MKIMVCVALLATVAARAEESSFVAEFMAAREIMDSKPDEAFDGMMRSYRLALAAGNEEYAACAVLKACFIRNDQGRPVDRGKIALEAIPEIRAMVDESTPTSRLRLGHLNGFVASGYEAEGRLGEAWRMNRTTAVVLRGLPVEVAGDGPPIRLGEIAGLPPMVRSLGWRTLEREAAYLDSAGRTQEAKALLDEAAAVIKSRWAALSGEERFYGFKVLCARAMTLDFLGYESEAIDEQRSLTSFAVSPGVSPVSGLILRVNTLVNRSKWEGPTQEMLDEMRGLDAALKAKGNVDGAGRPLPRLEFRLRKSRAAAEAIKEDGDRKKSRGLRHELFFSDRDYLVARAELGDTGLDGEYGRLLGELRAQGSKVSEPTIYREYGDYLLNGGRAAEAAGMYAEALRLTRGFGWFLHEPALLGALGEARAEAGDPAGAREALAELDEWLTKHGDAPVARRVIAEAARAEVLAKLGDVAAAAAAFSLAREWAVNLPEGRRRLIAPDAERSILADAKNVPVPGSRAKGEPPVHVSPVSVVSVSSPGRAARTRFSVFNPGGLRMRGAWKAVGEGARLVDGGVVFEAGKPVTGVSLVSELGAGQDEVWFASFLPAEGVGDAKGSVSWTPAGGNEANGSAWDVRWDQSAEQSVVLDASGLRSNPFRFVTLFHELSERPETSKSGVPFRLKSPFPLRIEYYETHSGHLLAVDANGNGDFTEVGDFHMGGGQFPAAAMVPTAPSGPGTAIEIHLLSVMGEPLPPSPGKPLALVAEVFRHGEWTKEGENVLE